MDEEIDTADGTRARIDAEERIPTRALYNGALDVSGAATPERAVSALFAFDAARVVTALEFVVALREGRDATREFVVAERVATDAPVRVFTALRDAAVRACVALRVAAVLRDATLRAFVVAFVARTARADA
ncbi:MAG: hypothetical protein II238_04970, partial [Alphaproteobacteria bacterium]|nr:hypothetical protein [Alphaproteobacteria bacterium]